MINLSGVKSVKGRLLALMSIVVAPLAVLSFILAFTTYQSVTASIEQSQSATVSNYAVRTRVWFGGMVRSLVVAVTALNSERGTSAACNQSLNVMLGQIKGWNAIQVTDNRGTACFASVDATLTPEVLKGLAADHRGKPFIEPWASTLAANTRYDATQIEGKTQIIIFASNKAENGMPWEATLVIDPAYLDIIFDIGENDLLAIVALIKIPGQLLVAQGKSTANGDWLPASEVMRTDMRRWTAKSKGGIVEAYGSKQVAETGLYLLAKFDPSRAKAALTQFLLLSLTPLLTLGLLFVTYARGIQTNVVRWIAGIEQAARARIANPESPAFAPIEPIMPEDVRNVAVSFNTLLQESAKREADLRIANQKNTSLMRELHHRVKNSLQVIQSYLALSRRQQTGPNHHLLETEAKVMVLSIAYRLALSEAGMQPVMLQPFVEEIINNLGSGLRAPGKTIETNVTTNALMSVDRIIPLGLALVEGLVAAHRAPECTRISVALITDRDGVTTFQIIGNGQNDGVHPNVKLMRGLSAQLGATPEAPSGSTLLQWTFASDNLNLEPTG